jgi:phytoene synthase
MPAYSPDIRFANLEDQAECRKAIKVGSHSFYAASLLLPAAIRKPAYGLYAFCRLSDDAIDLNHGSLLALERLRERLSRAYEGRPLPLAADRAMADLVGQFAIPRSVPEALFEGLEWDAQDRRYETLEDLFDYAARVAGTVGVMMTLIMGVRRPEALARACDLGVAMQLTNIARDVGEDAREGRLYLPLQWLREEGIDPKRFLDNPVLSAPLQKVIARLLGEAETLYERAKGGIAHLPLSCQPAILTAGLLYAEIGREIESLYFDSMNFRAHVSTGRKMQLLAKAVALTPWLKKDWSVMTLDAVRFLIEAVESEPVRVSTQKSELLSFKPQFLRVLEIFERLERADQFAVRSRISVED